MKVQCFYQNFSYTYNLLLHTHILHDNCIPPLTPFSAIINKSLFVNNSNFTPAFSKQACYANPGADKKSAGSILYILMHLLLKLLNTSANNNVLLLTYKS